MHRPILLHLHPEEKIVQVLRRHWLVFCGHIATALVIGSIFTAIVFWASSALNGLTWSETFARLHDYGWVFGMAAFGIPLIALMRLIYDFVSHTRTGDLEKIDRLVRYIKRYWYAILAGIVGAVIVTNLILAFLLIDVVAGHALPSVAGSLVTDRIGHGVLLVVTSMYALALLLYLFVAWMDYYFDVFIISNRQILNIQQLILVGQKITETNFQQIQNAYSKVSGMFWTLLDIGTVFVETAGEKENFQFNYVRNPGFAAKTILEIQQQQWEHGNIVENMDDDSAGEGQSEVFQYVDHISHSDTQETKKAHTHHHPSAYGAHPAHHGSPITQGHGRRHIYTGPERRQADPASLPAGRMLTDDGVIWAGESPLSHEIEQVLIQIDTEK